MNDYIVGNRRRCQTLLIVEGEQKRINCLEYYLNVLQKFIKI